MADKKNNHKMMLLDQMDTIGMVEIGKNREPLTRISLTILKRAIAVLDTLGYEYETINIYTGKCPKNDTGPSIILCPSGQVTKKTWGVGVAPMDWEDGE